MPDAPHLVPVEISRPERESVLPLLLLAEPSRSALEWSLENLSDTVYRFDLGRQPVAAATMQWADDPAELVELGVATAVQGRGIGRRVVAWLAAEARRRGKRAIEVGARSSAIGNLAFYQKCGFRPARVRRDYFWYYRPPIEEHGIPVRDMIVFELALEPDPQPHSHPHRRRRRGG